jgi:glycosyltransferase 2 family protein
MLADTILRFRVSRYASMRTILAMRETLHTMARRTVITWLQRIATAALLVLVAWLVYKSAKEMDWPAVWNGLKSYGAKSILVALVIALPGQLACAAFDLVGRHATGHKLSVPRTMLISYTGYYFSLNLGALVGGLAFRYRLYVPHGFSALRISQIIGLSVLTNWLGYILIAGIVLAFRPPELPGEWSPGLPVLRGVGFLFLATSALYVVACVLRGGTRIRIRDTELTLPGLRLAPVQYALSLLSWGTIGAVLVWLMPGDVGWFTIMPVLMTSALAGIWSHVPSGLGVTEVIFLAMLGGQVPESGILAALVVFRATYYLLPFVFAVFAYIYLEASAKSVAPEAG